MKIEMGKNMYNGLRVLLLTALCAAGVVFLTGCGDSPEAVVKKWHAAVSVGNQAEADMYVTGSKAEKFNKRMIGKLRDFEKDAKDNGGLGDHARKQLDGWKNMKFEKKDSSGDTATVTAASGDEKVEITLKKVDGKWKIDTDKSF